MNLEAIIRALEEGRLEQEVAIHKINEGVKELSAAGEKVFKAAGLLDALIQEIIVGGVMENLGEGPLSEILSTVLGNISKPF